MQPFTFYTRTRRRCKKRTKVVDGVNGPFSETDTDGDSQELNHVQKHPAVDTTKHVDENVASDDDEDDPTYDPDAPETEDEDEDDEDEDEDEDDEDSDDSREDSEFDEDEGYELDEDDRMCIEEAKRYLVREMKKALEKDHEDNDSDYDDDDDDNDDYMQGGPMNLVVPKDSIVIIPMPRHGPACSHDEDEDDDDDMDDDDNNNEGVPKANETPPPEKKVRIHYTREERAYLNNLAPEKRVTLEETEKRVRSRPQALVSQVPLRFRILDSHASDAHKQILIQKTEILQRMEPTMGEYHKLHNWLDLATRLPLGKYMPMKLQINDGSDKVRSFLMETKRHLDSVVFGHKDAKNQILRILAQWISNPGSKGNVIGIHGAMGCGKTSLVKDGISKALALPFAFIPLGGASDGAFLEGHSYTYEGATHGKIAEVLMKAECLNPVIFFDELDKVSDTKKGEEVASILMHVTDASQNERYTDKYFTDLDLDLSKALIVFSYNHEDKINPILRDRMITIKVNGYTTSEKKVIAMDYMLPAIYDQFGLTKEQVVLSPEMVQYIIQKVPVEDGVRNLRRGLESVISWVNMLRFIESEEIQLPFVITHEFIDKYVNMSSSGDGIPEHIRMSMYT